MKAVQESIRHGLLRSAEGIGAMNPLDRSWRALASRLSVLPLRKRYVISRPDNH
jgi:hypothetical protein